METEKLLQVGDILYPVPRYGKFEKKEVTVKKVTKTRATLSDGKQVKRKIEFSSSSYGDEKVEIFPNVRYANPMWYVIPSEKTYEYFIRLEFEKKQTQVINDLKEASNKVYPDQRTQEELDEIVKITERLKEFVYKSDYGKTT